MGKETIHLVPLPQPDPGTRVPFRQGRRIFCEDLFQLDLVDFTAVNQPVQTGKGVFDGRARDDGLADCAVFSRRVFVDGPADCAVFDRRALDRGVCRQRGLRATDRDIGRGGVAIMSVSSRGMHDL